MNTLPPPMNPTTFDQYPQQLPEQAPQQQLPPPQEQVQVPQNPELAGRSRLYQVHLEAAGGDFKGPGGKLLQKQAEADERWWQWRQRGLDKLREQAEERAAAREAEYATPEPPFVPPDEQPFIRTELPVPAELLVRPKRPEAAQKPPVTTRPLFRRTMGSLISQTMASKEATAAPEVKPEGEVVVLPRISPRSTAASRMAPKAIAKTPNASRHGDLIHNLRTRQALAKRSQRRRPRV
ncbi:MAG: hypothetical protein ABWX94_01020 [Candidatus Saccharimonadales bacterium]